MSSASCAVGEESLKNFLGMYRVDSARLRGWDYAAAGWYFVTICTKNRANFFGEVVEGDVRLSPVGQIVAGEWQRTGSVREGVNLDEWVVMPNHLHGIVFIAEMTPRPNQGTETGHRPVSTPLGLPTGGAGDADRRPTPPNSGSGSLGAVIAQFKSVCTKRIWAAGYANFAWQPRYHDHIIRSERSLAAIRAYIRDNPLNWDRDHENPASVT